MNHWNKLLPSVVKDGIDKDEADSLQQIEGTIHEITVVLHEKKCLLTNKQVGKLVRQINTHSTLKYTFKVTLLDNVMKVLMDMYLSGHLSVPMKIKVLDSMKSLCKKAKAQSMLPSADATEGSSMKFRFHYVTIWNEILSIVSRDSRIIAVSSEYVLSELLTALIDFLRGARSLIYTTENNVDIIENLIVQSMEQLKDVRYGHCVEGVLALINCMPTEYAHYDRLLPVWVDTWIGGSITSASGTTTAGQSGLDHNAHWDLAWLTLLARARKHYQPTADASGFTWSSLLPVLVTKAAELMHIPASAGVEGVAAVQNAQYPHTFHGHYVRMLIAPKHGNADVRATALKKLAKLYYFVTSTVSYTTTTSTTTAAGRELVLVPSLPLSITPPESTVIAINTALIPCNGVSGDILYVLPGAVDAMQLFQSLRTYFYPSNVGNWSALLSNFFMHYVIQLCRHVGHTLANTIVGTVPTGVSYMSPLHLPTVQYLVVNLLPFCLEGLYSKSPHMSQYCAGCIKNLLTVQPAVTAPIVIPFLLSALDPAAVSLAHQAPIAMQTLTVCFKSLMFPQPVLLPYLQDILRLSLPGIEPSDVMKTAITLNLYCTVLAWLPATLRDVDASVIQPAYLDIIQQQQQGADKSFSCGNTPSTPVVSVDTINAQLQELSDFLATEWSPAVLTRLFALLEAQEVAVEGAKPSPLAGSIGQLCSYLFQSVRPLPGLPSDHPQQIKQTELRVTLQNQIRKYFTTTTPLNGVKGSAKMIEAMVTSDPSILPAVLMELLCPAASVHSVAPTEVATVLLSAYSADKVAFRLRLAGGACRAATSDSIVPCLAFLQPIVTSIAYFNHEEKIVRTATSKMLKDILKGATSVYPTALEPVYTTNANRPVGFPSMHSADNVKWHVPSTAALPSIVSLLRQVVSASMNTMLTSLQAIIDTAALSTVVSTTASSDDLNSIPATPTATATPTASTSGNLAYKKIEELLVSRLWLIEKSLRGAAEVLGDLTTEPENLTTTLPEASWHLLSTGRENLLQSLSDENRQYLRTLRVEILRFLIQFQEILHNSTLSTQAFASLKNNITIQTLWVSLFNLVVTRRMACLKDVENVRKYMKYTILSGRSSISNVMYHRMRAVAFLSGGVEGESESMSMDVVSSNTTSTTTTGTTALLQSLDYWCNHDVTTSGLACMTWIQYIQRCRALSHDSIRRCTVPSYLHCLDILVQRLCTHEYDEIRTIALKQFDSVSSRFGGKMEVIVQNVLNTLTTLPCSYWNISGALSVLAQNRVQKRILGETHLLQKFLQLVLVQSQSIIATATDEADKREKLTNKAVEAMIKYIKRWSTQPALSGSDDNAFMLNLAMSCTLSTTSSSNGSDSMVTATGATGSAPGLRFETLAAYMALHIIGRPAGLQLSSTVPTTAPNAVDIVCYDTITSSALWQWVLTTLSNPQLHSQPSQGIALAALSRLSYLLNLYFNNTTPMTTAAAQCISLVRSYLSPTSPTSILRAIITSAALAHTRPTEEGASAQWGGGIAQIVQSSTFLKTVAPRKTYGLKSDQSQFSKEFHKENAVMFMSLAQAGVLCSDTTTGMFTAENITAVLACTADLPSSSEGEARLNNSTRAELFAGLLRAYRLHTAERRSTAGSNFALDAATEEVFLQCLKEAVEKASLDYARDWVEAVAFAFLDIPCILPGSSASSLQPCESIPVYLLERLVQTVLIPTAQNNQVSTSTGTGSGTTAESENTQNAESFTSQCKVLQLTCALVSADQVASYTTTRTTASNPTSLLGQAILQLLLAQPSTALISPYRSTRNDFAFLLHSLTENTALGRPEEIVTLCTSIAAQCEATAVSSSTEDCPTPTTTDDSLNNTTTNTQQVQVFKSAAETVCLLLRCSVHNLPVWRSHGVWRVLFAAALTGAGSMTSSAIETAKMCHETCLLVANATLRVATTSTTTTSTTATIDTIDVVSELLQYLQSIANNKTSVLPLHTRETMVKCVSLLMGNNWYCLSDVERKLCRDIFSQGIDDPKPEVQRLAQAGMVAYLATYKTVSEMCAIATVYTKNGDIYAAREKKLKKTTTDTTMNGSVKVDTKHQSTVLMMSCVLLATPYDLPHSYLPALLTAFVRHAAFPGLKDTVTRTVQLFKCTHQDRWEEFKKCFSADQLDELQATVQLFKCTHQDRWEEFKKCFSADQLDELQGTGAAHYYS